MTKVSSSLTKTVSVSEAVYALRAAGVGITERRFRQILITHQDNPKGVLRAHRASDGGWWQIECDSLDAYISRLKT